MHYDLKEFDSAAIPPDHIIKVYKRHKFMGWFNATYVYAQQQARLRLREAMLTFVWIETLVDHENRVIVRPNKIAKDLGITSATVYNHLTKIQAEGLMVPDDDDQDEKIIRAWRVSPFHAWRGKTENMAKYMDTLERDHPFFQYIDPEFRQTLAEEIGESR